MTVRELRDALEKVNGDLDVNVYVGEDDGGYSLYNIDDTDMEGEPSGLYIFKLLTSCKILKRRAYQSARGQRFSPGSREHSPINSSVGFSGR